jgi:hypothetical protein
MIRVTRRTTATLTTMSNRRPRLQAREHDATHPRWQRSLRSQGLLVIVARKCHAVLARPTPALRGAKEPRFGGD